MQSELFCRNMSSAYLRILSFVTHDCPCTHLYIVTRPENYCWTMTHKTIKTLPNCVQEAMVVPVNVFLYSPSTCLYIKIFLKPLTLSNWRYCSCKLLKLPSLLEPHVHCSCPIALSRTKPIQNIIIQVSIKTSRYTAIDLPLNTGSEGDWLGPGDAVLSSVTILVIRIPKGSICLAGQSIIRLRRGVNSSRPYLIEIPVDRHQLWWQKTRAIKENTTCMI